MERRRIASAVWLTLILLVAAGLLIWFVYRPWALSWGATPAETAGPMPGDAIVANPSWCATRAVTIEAPADAIWPWIVQMGYRRAGFYSYDRLDNDGIPSAETIIPEYQNLEVGDLIPLSRTSHVRVVEMSQSGSMVWVFATTGGGSEATWVWVLVPQGPDRTRLLTRLRVGPVTWRQRLFLDLGEIVMMRKCMLGIKRRAESMGSPGTPR
jgi:ribosomal protein S28E/S33